MELSIKDRLYIPAFLPKEGNFKQFNLKKEILKKIEIIDTERDEVNLRENEETKRIEWDIEKETPLHVDFSTDEMEYLKMICVKVSDEQFPDDMWISISKIYDSIAVN